MNWVLGVSMHVLSDLSLTTYAISVWHYTVLSWDTCPMYVYVDIVHIKIYTKFCYFGRDSVLPNTIAAIVYMYIATIISTFQNVHVANTYPSCAWCLLAWFAWRNFRGGPWAPQCAVTGAVSHAASASVHSSEHCSHSLGSEGCAPNQTPAFSAWNKVRGARSGEGRDMEKK